MSTPGNRKAQAGVPGLCGSGSVEVRKRKHSDSEDPVPTQGATLRSDMEQWCEHLEFRLALAWLKLTAGAPDGQFDALLAEIREFAAVGRAIAATRMEESEREEQAA